MQTKESRKSNDTSSDDDKKLIELMKTNDHSVENEEYNSNNNKHVINEKLQKSQRQTVNVAKKRGLYENLIKEATFDLTHSEEQFTASKNSNKSNIESKPKKVDSREETTKDNHEKSYKECDTLFNRGNINSNSQTHVQSDYTRFIASKRMEHESYEANPEIMEHASYEENSKRMEHESYEENSATVSSGKLYRETTSLSNQNIDKQSIKQIDHPDGSIEYRFSNGNIKKVFPDQGLTKLMYYNGDIRETNKDGKVKYFYASSRTWHTTMPDGLEILEFSDGQVERRSSNGTVEVSYPDGSFRILESDGFQKWTLTDGTLIQILTNGEKILTLPNGQREIHTNTHKRREYPDGTVKLIYPDGTQETRYSNGRIRLKDKDGNLLMDSYP